MTHLRIITPISPRDGQHQYALLREQVTKSGLLNRSYTYYWTLLFFNLSCFLVSLYFVIISDAVWEYIVWGTLFAFFSVQLAGIMHDAGHRAIFKTNKMNDLMGIFCCGMVAMGFSSWKIKHNLHHAHTNEEDEDPDIDLPILSFTVEQHRARRGFQKVLSKYQMYLYYPIGILVNFSVRMTSMRYFLNNFKKSYIVELAIFMIGTLILFVLPFYVFDTTKAVTLFVVVNVASGFYLLNVFAPNHKGMPILKKNQKISFLEQQIMTSRNIIGNFFTDYIYMGLNYQIEHHLFPNCPRNKLKRVSPLVKKLCKSMKIDYTEVGIIKTNIIILSELRKIAQVA